MQIPGHGSGLAHAQAPCLNLDHDTFDLFAVNGPPAEIGTSPGFFDGDIDSLEHLDMLKLIYFHNDTMGIEARHDLAERKQAVRGFMMFL